MMLQPAYPGRVSGQRSSTWTQLSPILAMLSENWRLTCGEAAWRLSFGLVGGSAALALSDSGATIAVWTGTGRVFRCISFTRVRSGRA